MKHLGYILKRLRDMNYKAMFDMINHLHKKTGKGRMWLLWDMQRCATNYGAGYMDYNMFDMYDLTPAQRDTFLTRGRNNDFVRKYNDPTLMHLFRNKDEFNALFDGYIGREWVTTDDRERALAFMEKYPVFMAKSLSGIGGKGVQKLALADYDTPEQALDTIVAEMGKCLLEEVIVQHPAVSSVYPNAVNTLRCVTIYKDGEIHFVGTCFRIGNHGNVVDNFSSGGMVAPVDVKTGIVTDGGIDRPKNKFMIHPMTGTSIVGFQFPDWQAAMDMVTEAAKVVPGLRYVGWDIAFSDKGPVLVEGNEFPGHDLFQLPGHNPQKTGIMDRMEV